jgi:hypothetical protein
LVKDADIVQSSVVVMKKVEKDRFKLPSSVQTNQDSHLDLVESDCELDHLALVRLCGDLTEDNNWISRLDLVKGVQVLKKSSRSKDEC